MNLKDGSAILSEKAKHRWGGRTMPFDGITLNAVKQELEQLLPGSRVDKVYQPEKNTIVIRFRARSGSLTLLLSCRADSARIHLIEKKPENPRIPPVFCMVLRKHLEGGKLTSVEQVGLERILTLNFESINEAGSLEHLFLHCEIMGKHSNLVLTDASNNVILDGAKRFTHEVNRFREILPGIPYKLPPSQNKENLLLLTEDRFYSLVLAHPLETPLDKILLQTLEGFSPLLCREIVFRAGLAPKTVLNSCGEYELGRLWQELEAIAKDISLGHFSPVLVLKENIYTDYSPIDLHQFTHREKKYFARVNEALMVFFAARDRANSFQEKKQRLERVVNNHVKKTRNKLKIQQQELAATESAETDRISGELITANMYRVSRGDTELKAQNYYDPEQKEIVIPLDPSLSPSQNAQGYFKKYRKAAVKQQKATEYIRRFQEELLYLDSVNLAIETAQGPEDLEEIEEELLHGGYIRQEKGKTLKSKPQEHLVFEASHGFKILVGKNNRQNDILTLKIAKDEDIWLHTKDIPGAHVIIKAEGKAVPEEIILEAAMLAAYFSKGRQSGKVPVDFTLRKHVRKPRGAKPGLVIYDHQSTVYVTPDEEKVKQLQVTT